MIVLKIALNVSQFFLLLAGLPVIQRESVAYDYHPVSDCCNPVSFSGQRDHYDALHTCHYTVQSGNRSLIIFGMYFYNNEACRLFSGKSYCQKQILLLKIVQMP